MVDFNAKLLAAIDETMSNLLGKNVLETLHEHLAKEYDLAPDKVPYRLDTFVEVLDTVFGVPGSRTIEREIARKFYSKLGLRFDVTPNFRLQDYVEEAITIRPWNIPIDT